MRRALALVVFLAGCGKTGDSRLQAAAQSDVVDIREPDFSMHLERHGRRFDWKSVTVRHDKSDVERRDDGSVDAAVVDGFLRAVADGRIKTNGLEDLPIRVTVTPRVGDTLIELRLRGNEPDYAAILTSTGRPKPL